MGSKGQKVLGLTWNSEEDTISLDLAAIAKRAEGLTATKRNTEIISENLRSTRDHRTSDNNCEDFVSRSVLRENQLGRPTRRIDKEGS